MRPQTQPSEGGFMGKFKTVTGISLYRAIALFVIIVVLNNAKTYSLQKSFLQPDAMFGDPPIQAVLLNALIAVIVFAVVIRVTKE